MGADDISTAARPPADTVRGLAGDWLLWAIAGGVGGLTLAVAGLVDDIGNPAAMLAFAAIPIAGAALGLAALLRRGAVLAAASVALAISPAVQALSGGRWQGAAAVLAAVAGAAMARSAPGDRRAVRLSLVAALSVLLLVTWVWRTPLSRPAPTWARVVTGTGRRLWETLGTVGTLTRVPTTAWLAWWLAVGVVVGAVFVGGRWRVAAAAFGAVGVAVAAGTLLAGWRGSVDMSGGMWIVTGPLAYAGASARLDPPAERRVAGGVAALLAIVWIVTLAHLARL